MALSATSCAARTRSNGRLLVAALALLLSTPFMYLALTRGPGDLLGFGVFMALGGGLMFVYYSTVYSTIQDVIEPSCCAWHGDMAIYFFAMYVVLGGSFGPVLTGFLSEGFTRCCRGNGGRCFILQGGSRAVPRRRSSFSDVSCSRARRNARTCALRGLIHGPERHGQLAALDAQTGGQTACRGFRGLTDS